MYTLTAGFTTLSKSFNYRFARDLPLSIILFILGSFLLLINLSNTVYADGLFEEQLSASLGNRKADLLIKMSPPVVTTETIKNQSQKPIIQFRLFDSIMNKSFDHVTYFITIEKEGKRLLTNWFHDHAGDLRIQMNPRNTSQIVVYGEQDPILNAYTGTPQSPVVAAGPIFLEGGLYHFIVRIATVDYDRTLIPDNQQPVYDGYLSVGNTQNYVILKDSKEVPIKIISYYDELKNITYDQKNNELKFHMPFDWNTGRIKNVNIFVHEEVSVPKPSSFSSQSYSGKVNGISAGKMLIIDPSNSTKDVIHFMIPKDELISIAEKINANGQSSTGIMDFALKPEIGAPPEETMTMNMSTMESFSKNATTGLKTLTN